MSIFVLETCKTIKIPVDRVRVMVFNTTFNNIAVISWRPVLLVEETSGPGENFFCFDETLHKTLHQCFLSNFN
jgi:hypothetical protein